MRRARPDKLASLSNRTNRGLLFAVHFVYRHLNASVMGAVTLYWLYDVTPTIHTEEECPAHRRVWKREHYWTKVARIVEMRHRAIRGFIFDSCFQIKIMWREEVNCWVVKMLTYETHLLVSVLSLFEFTLSLRVLSSVALFEAQHIEPSIEFWLLHAVTDGSGLPCWNRSLLDSI